MAQNVHLTGKEVFFPKTDFIVSKTDTKGIIQYGNKIFIDIAGYTESELIGKPHNILRHPDMPHSVFKLFWEYLQRGDEIFAYVVNKCKNGDHYWVFAHATPSVDKNGKTVAYHSNRRVPDPQFIQGTIVPLYAKLREIEASERNSNAGMAKAYQYLMSLINKKHGDDYNAWLLDL